MIVSIHVPKTGGESFGARILSTFGSRAFFDYGDRAGINTPEIVARRELRKAEMHARKDELLRNYDVIHGAFIGDKYLGLFPNAGFVAFFREPYQQAVSNYEYLLRRPDLDHPAVRLVHDSRLTLIEFIAALPDLQSRFLGRVGVDDLAVVGLLEHYDRGVALFEAVFGCKMAPETSRVNVNPNRHGDTYPIEPAVRKAVETHRAGDIALYRRACEKFSSLSLHYGI